MPFWRIAMTTNPFAPGRADLPSSTRRDFLVRLPLAGAALAAPALLTTRTRAASASGAVVAKTIHGRVRGARREGVAVFKGIPYAGSPAGQNRFKPAPKLVAWKDVRDALLYGPQSMQPPDPAWPKEWKPAISSEDCLYLNVWTRGIADGKRRPVMFYSHGGGFSSGNGGADVAPQDAFHDGLALARDYDVVVVTHNHRLGIMGYLYLAELLGEEYAASGAVGMLDIARALEWVRDNVAEFGGDPGSVMIWGESGGGAKTSALTAMPAAQGLYHKASIESGAALRLRTPESAVTAAREVLSVLGIEQQRARELLRVPAEKLIEAAQSLPRRPATSDGSVSSGLTEGLGFSPVVDGSFFPAHPYDPVAPTVSANVPLITGINKDETIFMMRGTPEVFSMDEAGLRQRLEPLLKERTNRVLEAYSRSRPNASPVDLYVAITTARWMWMDTVTLAERKVALEAAPVFMYVFAFESEVPAAPGVDYPSGAAHAAEIPFKFNHPESGFTGQRKARFKAARNMSRAWATFARTGNPSHDEIPRWPRYTLDERATMFLDAECRVVNDPWREERLLWREVG